MGRDKHGNKTDYCAGFKVGCEREEEVSLAKHRCKNNILTWK
jgi:hypothetical protein